MAQPIHRLAQRRGRRPARGGVTRDAYTFGHIPLVAGIIALAIGFEASFDQGHFSTARTAATIGVGLFLFLMPTALALFRAKGCVLWNRVIMMALTLVGLAWGARHSVQHVLAVAAAGLVVVVLVEQSTIRRRLVARNGLPRSS